MVYLGGQKVGLNALTIAKDSNDALRFIDYDGTVLTSYSKLDANALTALPELPSHAGLSAQGWNYTLEQVKSNLSSTGKCDVGCIYTTDDGKTRITLTIQDPKYSNIPLVFEQTTANGVQLDWGDGSPVETFSSTSQLTATHQYQPSAYPATYTVTFNVMNGKMSFPTNIMGKGVAASESTSNLIAVWTNMIDSVNIGNSVTSIGYTIFSNCYSLTSITIPSSVIGIGNSAFKKCYSLTSISIPSSVTIIDSGAFSDCYSLTSISIPSSVTSIESAVFYGCYSLTSITIPSSVTSIGGSAFYGCYSLTSITIPSLVTSIGQYAFYGCCSLALISIPSSVTSVGQYAFYGCCSLASISIPSSVTNIGQYAFSSCYGLATFDFRTFTSVPTLQNINALQNTQKTREIIVPDELYDSWKSASNWSSTANNIVGSIVKASESSLGPLS